MCLPILLSFFVLFFATISAQECPLQWTSYNGHCYRHFFNTNDRVTYVMAQDRCKQYGARLTDIRDREEMMFIGDLVRTPGRYVWTNLPLVGLRKTGFNNPVNAYDNSKAYVNWCKNPKEPSNYLGKEYCIAIMTEAALHYPAPSTPCLLDLLCEGTNILPHRYSRYVCKMAIPLVCDKPNTEVFNGTCRCTQGYIDITETDVPERQKYKHGEKCIPKDPCKSVTELTVNFLVDSSQSIGSTNWDSLVKFLHSGADLLPNSTRVGFVKFSNKITFAKFLAPGWSQADFKNFVPSLFDNGETNTAAAFEKATAMFKKDKTKNQIAVLITDGLPFSGEIDEKDMLAKTSKAAKKLRSSGVSLIALGYGEDLDKKKIRVIHSWLEDPEEDYFEYDKKACDLKSVHMCLLMRKVCRRFVNY